MKNGLITTLLIVGGLYIFTNKKKVESSPVYINPAIKDRPKPINKSAVKPIHNLLNPEVRKMIIEDPNYATGTTTANPKNIGKDYVPIGGDITEEIYSRQSGEILPDRDFNFKNVDSNYQDNLYQFVQIGYKPTTGFGGSGLADR